MLSLLFKTTLFISLALLQSKSIAHDISSKKSFDFQFLPKNYKNHSASYFSSTNDEVLLLNCYGFPAQECVIKVQSRNGKNYPVECSVKVATPDIFYINKPIYLGDNKVLLSWSPGGETEVQIIDLLTCASISKFLVPYLGDVSLYSKELGIFPFKRSFEIIHRDAEKIVRLVYDYSGKMTLASPVQIATVYGGKKQEKEILHVMPVSDLSSDAGYYMATADWNKTFLDYGLRHLSKDGQVYFDRNIDDPAIVKLELYNHKYFSNAYDVFTFCFHYDELTQEKLKWACIQYNRKSNRFTKVTGLRLLHDLDSDVMNVFNLQNEGEILFVTANCKKDKPLMTLTRFNMISQRVIADDTIYLAKPGHCQDDEQIKNQDKYRINIVEKSADLFEMYISYEAENGNVVGIITEKFNIKLDKLYVNHIIN